MIVIFIFTFLFVLISTISSIILIKIGYDDDKNIGVMIYGAIFLVTGIFIFVHCNFGCFERKNEIKFNCYQETIENGKVIYRCFEK